jgi:hypothetical protein
MQYRRSVQGRIFLTELETSARSENKRMTNHNTPQLSRMGLPVHCATFHGLSRLNTRAVSCCVFCSALNVLWFPTLVLPVHTLARCEGNVGVKTLITATSSGTYRRIIRYEFTQVSGENTAFIFWAEE